MVNFYEAFVEAIHGWTQDSLYEAPTLWEGNRDNFGPGVPCVRNALWIRWCNQTTYAANDFSRVLHFFQIKNYAFWIHLEFFKEMMLKQFTQITG